MDKRDKLPLIYSCSGCSNIAQLANKIAVDLDRQNLVEMSCIAGVGGDVPLLVKKAKSNRDIIAIDGCQLQCSLNCLNKHEVEPALHITLTDYGLKKRYHEDLVEPDAVGVAAEIIATIEKFKQKYQC